MLKTREMVKYLGKENEFVNEKWRLLGWVPDIFCFIFTNCVNISEESISVVSVLEAVLDNLLPKFLYSKFWHLAYFKNNVSTVHILWPWRQEFKPVFLFLPPKVSRFSRGCLVDVVGKLIRVWEEGFLKASQVIERSVPSSSPIPVLDNLMKFLQYWSNS